MFERDALFVRVEQSGLRPITNDARYEWKLIAPVARLRIIIDGFSVRQPRNRETEDWAGSLGSVSYGQMRRFACETLQLAEPVVVLHSCGLLSC